MLHIHTYNGSSGSQNSLSLSGEQSELAGAPEFWPQNPRYMCVDASRKRSKQFKATLLGATFCLQVATLCNILVDANRPSAYALAQNCCTHNAVTCCVEMLWSFGRGSRRHGHLKQFAEKKHFSRFKVSVKSRCQSSRWIKLYNHHFVNQSFIWEHLLDFKQKDQFIALATFLFTLVGQMLHLPRNTLVCGITTNIKIVYGLFTTFNICIVLLMSEITLDSSERVLFICLNMKSNLSNWLCFFKMEIVGEQISPQIGVNALYPVILHHMWWSYQNIGKTTVG